MAYLATIEHRIAGIPCLIGVRDFVKVQGSFSFNAPSDLDYSGYTEMSYDVLDRKGLIAAWLERKVTDDSDIREVISKELS